MSATLTETSMPPAPAYFPLAAASSQDTTTGNSSGSTGYNEKRTEYRYSTSDEVRVWLSSMPSVEIPAVLCDVSRSGFRVELSLPVLPGSGMKVCIRDRTTIFAIARYCRQASGKYQVGASIENVYYQTAAVESPHYMVAIEAGTVRAQLQRVLSSDSGDCSRKDLACAIIDDHTLFSVGSQNRLSGVPPLPDRLA